MLAILLLIAAFNLFLGKKKFDFDNSIEVKMKNLSPVTISEQLAKALFVRVVAS